MSSGLGQGRKGPELSIKCPLAPPHPRLIESPRPSRCVHHASVSTPRKPTNMLESGFYTTTLSDGAPTLLVSGAG